MSDTEPGLTWTEVWKNLSDSILLGPYVAVVVMLVAAPVAQWYFGGLAAFYVGACAVMILFGLTMGNIGS